MVCLRKIKESAKGREELLPVECLQVEQKDKLRPCDLTGVRNSVGVDDRKQVDPSNKPTSCSREECCKAHLIK